MRRTLKQFIFRMLGKDPEAIVVSFASGDAELVRRMHEEIRQLEPQRRHFLVTGEEFSGYWQLRRRFRAYRIGLAVVLFTPDARYRALRRAACLLAPTKILAYNQRLERHHLRVRTAIASWLFLKGVPLDRIFLRPKWLAPWKKDRSVFPTDVREIEGRPLAARRRRIAVLSPYFPFPLSHGGAVRIFNLLREMAQEFDIFLFAFRDRESDADFQPVLELCARVILVGKSRYREPRWSTLLPSEAHEFHSPAMLSALHRLRSEYTIEATQVEYTMLAPYAGDVLVEHDVTFELCRQVYARTHRGWWDYWRWRRFEKRWITRYRRVAVMSEQDRALLGQPHVVVVPNGVDLTRFTPEIERPGRRLLFVGSFRHFPNIVAYRFFIEQIWPALRERLPDVQLTVVAGPDPLIYWREHTGLPSMLAGDRIQLLEFVADVRPLYVEANLAIVPTLVSAGTNLKVLEAMAMDRAVVSTSSGCAGLGLEHGVNVWIADTPQDFAQGIETLLIHGHLRDRMAAAARLHVERNFDWRAVGVRQRALIRELLPARVQIRQAVTADLDQITAIQATAPEASQWQTPDYLSFDCQVAMLDGQIAGFVVSRTVGDREREILNVAVRPDLRRLHIATELLRAEIQRWPGAHFLEVRESNTGARQLYQRLGFEAVGSRPGYYENPPEAGIVMRVFS
ncbi:MAG TPA: GNAT family N-acetyltransferase [Bryobacteraceae bacterium]|nr:GNAT family N-acetyltransferase [Bryobacteraceae bacterium]